MKITDATDQGSITTFCDRIPEGQVFRGTVQARSGAIAGVFYKAAGSVRVGDETHLHVVRHAAAVLVRLDSTKTVLGKKNLFLDNYRVTNYQPLDVELVIKGVQR